MVAQQIWVYFIKVNNNLLRKIKHVLRITDLLLTSHGGVIEVWLVQGPRNKMSLHGHDWHKVWTYTKAVTGYRAYIPQSHSLSTLSLKAYFVFNFLSVVWSADALGCYKQTTGLFRYPFARPIVKTSEDSFRSRKPFGWAIDSWYLLLRRSLLR